MLLVFRCVCSFHGLWGCEGVLMLLKCSGVLELLVMLVCVSGAFFMHWCCCCIEVVVGLRLLLLC